MDSVARIESGLDYLFLGAPARQWARHTSAQDYWFQLSL